MMVARNTVLMLALAEGAALWLAVTVGIAFADHDLSLAGPSPALALELCRGLAFASICVLSLYFADLYDIVTLRRPAAFPERLPYALAVEVVDFGPRAAA